MIRKLSFKHCFILALTAFGFNTFAQNYQARNSTADCDSTCMINPSDTPNSSSYHMNTPSTPVCQVWQTETNNYQFNYVPSLNGPEPAAAAAGWSCVSWNPVNGKMTCVRQVCVK